jgi:hypothetical protein
VTGQDEYSDVESFAAVINSRLAAEARISRAIAFGWLCGGWAIASCLIGLGAVAALYGYSLMISVTPAAELTASALHHAFARAELKTSVTGTLSLAPGAELTLARDQTVKLAEGAVVKLDPSSSVRVVGDLKVDVPQPSKQQLQLDATSGSKELPFTQYTVFKTEPYGTGYVVTSWNFGLSETSRPYHQRCYYEQNLDQGLAATQTIAVDGSPRRVSTLAKLPFDFDGALASCTWFSG